MKRMKRLFIFLSLLALVLGIVACVPQQEDSTPADVCNATINFVAEKGSFEQLANPVVGTMSTSYNGMLFRWSSHWYINTENLAKINGTLALELAKYNTNLVNAGFRFVQVTGGATPDNTNVHNDSDRSCPVKETKVFLNLTPVSPWTLQGSNFAFVSANDPRMKIELNLAKYPLWKIATGGEKVMVTNTWIKSTPLESHPQMFGSFVLVLGSQGYSSARLILEALPANVFYWNDPQGNIKGIVTSLK